MIRHTQTTWKCRFQQNHNKQPPREESRKLILPDSIILSSSSLIQMILCIRVLYAKIHQIEWT
jgi:hypothetical protein